MGKLDEIRALREGRHSSRGRAVKSVEPHKGTISKDGEARAAEVATGPREAIKPRLGRPRIEDKAKTLTATKPWVAAGMSRATWYNRRVAERSIK